MSASTESLQPHQSPHTCSTSVINSKESKSTQPNLKIDKAPFLFIKNLGLDIHPNDYKDIKYNAVISEMNIQKIVYKLNSTSRIEIWRWE